MNRNGDKVTTNRHSQGIRFLNAVTGVRLETLFAHAGCKSMQWESIPKMSVHTL